MTRPTIRHMNPSPEERAMAAWPQERLVSIPPRFRPDCPPPNMVTQAEAERHGWVMQWRGRIEGAAYTLVIIAAIELGVSQAFAGNTASWGGTGCQLVPVSGQAHVAELHCSNTHTSGAAFTEGAMTADGLTVSVAILHGPGDIPDQFSFAPMPGFYADPPSMMLDEHTSGVVLIFEYVGS